MSLEITVFFLACRTTEFQKSENYDKFIHIERDLYYSETEKYILYTTHCKKD
jgi:hypothetical protein